MKDINGTEIQEGDTVEVSIRVPYQGAVKYTGKVIARNGGLILLNDGIYSKLPKPDHNVDLRVLGSE